MRRSLRLVIAIAVAGLGAAARAGAQTPPTPAAIAAQFYPQRLVEAAERAGDVPVDRRQCQAVVDTVPSGAPRTILAAYTNTSSAAMLMLQSDGGGGFRVAASEPQGLDLFGSDCDVKLLDVDRDGRPEIIVTFSMMVNDITWVMKWDGQQLVNLTPLERNPDGTGMSLLRNAELVDVDNDGIPEITVLGQYPPPSDGSPAKPDSVFKLSGGSYVETEPIVGLWVFERSTGAPETDRVPVPLPAGARGPFTLHIVNGDPGGRSRVTSAEVFLNGERVLSPNDFGNRVDAIDRPVNLTSDNELAVRVAGEPGSRMVVILRSRDWDR
jgi:hypothetical protein